MEDFKVLTEKEKPPQKGDKMKVKRTSINNSNHLNTLQGLELEIDYTKVSDLGDMIANTVYFKTDINTEKKTIVKNPYLLSDFVKV